MRFLRCKLHWAGLLLALLSAIDLSTWFAMHLHKTHTCCQVSSLHSTSLTITKHSSEYLLVGMQTGCMGCRFVPLRNIVEGLLGMGRLGAFVELHAAYMLLGFRLGAPAYPLLQQQCSMLRTAGVLDRQAYCHFDNVHGSSGQLNCIMYKNHYSQDLEVCMPLTAKTCKGGSGLPAETVAAKGNDLTEGHYVGQGKNCDIVILQMYHL